MGFSAITIKQKHREKFWVLLLEQFHQRSITQGMFTAFIGKLLIQQGQNLHKCISVNKKIKIFNAENKWK